MRLISLCLSLLLILCISSVDGQSSYIEGQVYFRLKEGSSLGSFDKNDAVNANNNPLQAIYLKYGGVKCYPAFPKNSSLSGIYKLVFTKTTQEDIEHLMTDLNHLDDVLYSEQVLAPEICSITNVPGDMNADLMWYIDQINMDWDLPLNNGFKVKIAIVDNGVRLTHEDIEPNLWTNPGEIPNNHIDDDGNGYVDDIHGWDAADSNNSPTPPLDLVSDNLFNHGTQVAGISSASTNNSKGMVSIGFNTEIIAVKCASDNSNGKLLPGAAEGIAYAVAAGAHIINISWGSETHSQTIKDAIDFALASGVIVIAAAGNGNSSNAFYPAAYDGVIGVGATSGEYDFKYTKSNYGYFVDVMAPGENIYTTNAGSDNSYAAASGTSMATPIVSALAGLLMSQFPDKRELIEVAILKGCDNIDLNNEKYAGQLGAGRINIHRSYELMKNPSLSVHTPALGALKVYPNPSNGVLNFHNEDALETLEVYDLSGKLVSEVSVVNNRVDLKALNLKGMYLLRSRTESSQLSARILFQ